MLHLIHSRIRNYLHDPLRCNCNCFLFHSTIEWGCAQRLSFYQKTYLHPIHNYKYCNHHEEIYVFYAPPWKELHVQAILSRQFFQKSTLNSSLASSTLVYKAEFVHLSNAGLQLMETFGWFEVLSKWNETLAFCSVVKKFFFEI